ncbi:uncharacterized protein SCHCODRAFT_02604559 [Schizophyllum commune H4-8]|uniref:uncharacterized protein n=1 Tax=Schizophyllum commune (strain H4-8 / FGSC 9210) TaxID=578458 RepID=UPI00215FA5CD|nr:uncharacterized protein SCHCODRAFT_02604559 [Schizophyllum commune H4-8]KAI5899237.1 hypothetical protein SCHCODRAFT_02604559 [Schizophyllum commune H4-8]
MERLPTAPTAAAPSMNTKQCTQAIVGPTRPLAPAVHRVPGVPLVAPRPKPILRIAYGSIRVRHGSIQ